MAPDGHKYVSAQFSEERQVEMGGSGPLSWHGRDLYRTNAPLYYTLHVLLWLYGLGVIAALVILLNVHVEHTYVKVPGAPGALFTERFVTLRWSALMLVGLRIFVPIVVAAIVLFRRETGCGLLWVGVLVVLVLAEGLVVFFFSRDYLQCNEPGEGGNMCNSLLYCCVPAVNSQAESMCPNPAGSTCPVSGSLPNPPTTVDELRPRGDFLWLFWTSVVFLALDAAFFVLFFIVWMAGSSPRRRVRAVKPKAQKPETPSTSARIQHHGLRGEGDTTVKRR